ncbi:MAG: hypothetical protein KTR30_10980 [Saprospiraceae bacterium]|nr:hypothetical protein [Saprospiraceae bacterium]
MKNKKIKAAFYYCLLAVFCGACGPSNSPASEVTQDGSIDISAAIDQIIDSDGVKTALQNFQMEEVVCDSIDPVLAEVYRKDQEVRRGAGDMMTVDQENRKTVISILEKCGFPKADEVALQSYNAIFFVLQHSPGPIMGYYYPQVEAAVTAGKINRSTFALMQDRLLMDFGYKQVYGTQIRNNQLYELQDPDNVNARRAEVGLGPIETYVEYFKLNYEEEIKRMKNQSNAEN